MISFSTRIVSRNRIQLYRENENSRRAAHDSAWQNQLPFRNASALVLKTVLETASFAKL